MPFQVRLHLQTRMNRALALALGLVLAVPPGFGQSQQNPESGKDTARAADTKTAGGSEQNKDAVATIAVDVKVVALPVTVRDKHGAVVKDLTKDDFTLQEDGRPQAIKYFSLESNLPLTLGLLVDTSRSQRDALDEERNASRTFFDQMLTQEKDKAFVLHFDREVELLQDLTHKREKLQSALDLLKTADDDSSRVNAPSNDDSRTGHRRGGTELYDALYLGANEVMKKQPGRKAVVILSDGVDHGSKTTLASAIEAAQRSDTIVYAIYFKGHEYRDEHRGSGYPGHGGGHPGGYPGGGSPWPGGGYPGGGRPPSSPRPSDEPRVDGKKILERIAKETGGRFFEVSKKQLVGDIYSSITDELRTQYNLGFTPDKDAAGEGYHHVVLQVKKKDLVVRTREGYYGGGEG